MISFNEIIQTCKSKNHFELLGNLFLSTKLINTQLFTEIKSYQSKPNNKLQNHITKCNYNNKSKYLTASAYPTTLNIQLPDEVHSLILAISGKVLLFIFHSWKTLHRASLQTR